MNNKITCFLITILVTGFITGCTKKVEKSTNEASFIGTWEWVRTDGGFAFHIHETPVTIGKNIDLKITADGKYFIYTNSVLTSEGTYVLETRKCIHDYTDKTFINSPDFNFMVEHVDKENMEVSDENDDGVGSLYKRKLPCCQ